jgi:hypothetical protein
MKSTQFRSDSGTQRISWLRKKIKIDSYIGIFRLKILDTIEGVALVLGSNRTDKQITCIYCKKRHISLK